MFGRALKELGIEWIDAQSPQAKGRIEREMLNPMPKFDLLDETDKVRQGFLTRAQFDALYALLPEDLRDFSLFAYLTGMRLKEIKPLTWSDSTDDGGRTVLRLLGKNTKTGKPRQIVVACELVQLFQLRKEPRVIKTATGISMSNFIFHRSGKRVGEFRESWISACVAAGVGKLVCKKCESEGPEKTCPQCKAARIYRGIIFHDTRRCRVRNLRRAGNSETLCMAITGHRTRRCTRPSKSANRALLFCINCSPVPSCSLRGCKLQFSRVQHSHELGARRSL